MATAVWALGLYALYLLLLFGFQSIQQLKETGTSGWMKGVGDTPVQRGANLLFVVSTALDFAGPSLALAGAIRPPGALDSQGLHVLGLLIFTLAAISALAARHQMAGAWRTGIDPSTRAPLVTVGLFAVVRNPVYTAMIGISIAVALLVPTLVTFAAIALTVLALEMQTRLIEEPFMRRMYDRQYAEYLRHAGRFVPWVGRRTEGG